MTLCRAAPSPVWQRDGPREHVLSRTEPDLPHLDLSPGMAAGQGSLCSWPPSPASPGPLPRPPGPLPALCPGPLGLSRPSAAALTRRHSPGMLLWQLPLPLHVEHEVPSIDVLYDQEEPGGGQRGRAERVWDPPGQKQPGCGACVSRQGAAGARVLTTGRQLQCAQRQPVTMATAGRLRYKHGVALAATHCPGTCTCTLSVGGPRHWEQMET